MARAYGYDNKRWFRGEVWCGGKLLDHMEESETHGEAELRYWVKADVFYEFRYGDRRCIGRLVLLEKVLGGDKPWNNEIQVVRSEITVLRKNGNITWKTESL